MLEDLENEGREVPIEWESPNVPVVFADNIVVRNTGHEFILYFYQILPPIITGTQKQQEEQLKKIDSFKASNVACVMLTPSRIPGLIHLLERNYENFLRTDSPVENLEE